MSADLFYYKRVTEDTEDEVKTMISDNGMLFSFIDMCRALKIKNFGDATQYIEEEEFVEVPLKTDTGRSVEMMVTESAIYKLVLKSQTQYTHKFINWLCKDILPTLRQEVAKFEGKEEIINFVDRK